MAEKKRLADVDHDVISEIAPCGDQCAKFRRVIDALACLADQYRFPGANRSDMQSHHLAGVGFHHAQSSIALDATIHMRAKRDDWRVGEKNRARDIIGDPLQVVRQADYGREGGVFFPASP